MNIINLKKIRILLTGNRGSIGKFLTNRLSNKNYEIVNLDILRHDNCLTLMDEIDFDIFDYVLHFGASSDRNNKNLQKIFENNILFTENLFKKISSFHKVKVIFLSAMSIVSQSSRKLISSETNQSAKDFYSLSKLIGEKLLLEYIDNERSLIIRVPSVYGTARADADGLLSRWKKLFLRNKDVIVKGKNRKTNSAILSGSFIDFLETIMQSDILKFEDFLFLASSDHLTFGEIALRMKDKLSSESNILFEDISSDDHYLINVDASVKYGYKAECMDVIIDSICKN